jgi:hypothetical protein
LSRALLTARIYVQSKRYDQEHDNSYYNTATPPLLRCLEDL